MFFYCDKVTNQYYTTTLTACHSSTPDLRTDKPTVGEVISAIS